jgi:restriction system protein
VARKRGFFAEIQHQNQLAGKRRQQAASAAARANAAAAHNAEQARMRATQAQAQMQRATVAEQKKAQQEAQRLHGEARQAEAEAMNAQLEQTREEIASILPSALKIDPFVDLEPLRRVADHPPFARTDLESPLPPPALLTAREEPAYVEPPAPKGVGGLLGGKRKHAEAIAAAQAEFGKRYALWQAEVAGLPAAQLRQMQGFQHAEHERIAALDRAGREYQSECDRRDAEVAAANTALDHLIQGLAAGTQEAVDEYMGIVLGNSLYPEFFPVEHEFSYEATQRELSVTVTVPHPSTLPLEREFRYNKSKDEIVPTPLPQKDLKDRYLQALCQVSLRTVHEVFTADRSGQIRTIALTVGTEGIDSATGLTKRTSLVAVAAERTRFQTFDLANVVPLATLEHLGALISKRPLELEGIDASKAIRG